MTEAEVMKKLYRDLWGEPLPPSTTSAANIKAMRHILGHHLLENPCRNARNLHLFASVYGFYNCRPQTMTDVAKKYGLSKSRVSSIVHRLQRIFRQPQQRREWWRVYIGERLRTRTPQEFGGCE